MCFVLQKTSQKISTLRSAQFLSHMCHVICGCLVYLYCCTLDVCTRFRLYSCTSPLTINLKPESCWLSCSQTLILGERENLLLLQLDIILYYKHRHRYLGRKHSCTCMFTFYFLIIPCSTTGRLYSSCNFYPRCYPLFRTVLRSRVT